jgi:hypothetical protein
MAANREVVQRRTFAKGFTRNFSVFLAFYKSTTLKRKPNSKVRSTVGQDFDAKLCNSAERTRRRNCELPSISNDMQSSETLRNSLGLNYKSAALNQLSYAGVSP